MLAASNFDTLRDILSITAWLLPFSGNILSNYNLKGD